MFPFADPFRLAQAWCEAATAVTRANMATCTAASQQALSFWTTGLTAGVQPPSQPALGAMFNFNPWAPLSTSYVAPFAGFGPAAAFSPFQLPPAIAFNPWGALPQMNPAAPLMAMLDAMTQAVAPSSTTESVRSGDRKSDADEARVTTISPAYRGAGGYAVPPTIKITAEVPMSAVAALWGWPWANQRFA